MNRSLPTSRARRWLAGLSALALVGAVGLIPAASVAAAEPPNPVLDWNINAVNAIGNPAPDVTTPPTPRPWPATADRGHPPGDGAGAVYDAVNAIDGGHEPYLSGLPSAPGASEAAAVATAAHDVLVALPPLHRGIPTP